MRNWLKPTCLTCSLWGLGCFISGFVFILVLSQLALTFLIEIIKFFFGTLQVGITGILLALAGLSIWAALPLAITLIIVLWWAFRAYNERRQWRGLERVREEFVPLQRLLRSRGLKTYLTQLEKVKMKLFAERDRIEAMQGILDEELPRIEARLAELSEQLSKAEQEDERAEFRALMNELISSSARLRARRDDPEQFNKAQVRVASRLNLLRQRLSRLPAIGSISASTKSLDSVESFDSIDSIDSIMSDLESISLIENLFSQEDHQQG